MNTQLLERNFDSKEYKRSRVAYMMECTFEYFVSLFVIEAYLAKVLQYIGVEDSLIGIISSLISLSQLFQLFSIFVVQKICNTKRFVVSFHMIGQLLFMSLYFVPFMPFANEYRAVIAVFCILAAYFGNYFVTNIIYNWGNSYVEPHHRARFGATKESISLVTGVAMTLIVGQTMDAFDANQNPEGGFIFAAIAILIFCVADFVCLMFIKNDIKPKQDVEKAEPLHKVMKKLGANKGFWNVIILQVIWNVAIYTTVGFLGTYRINENELAFTVGQVAVINVVGCLGRAALSRPFGKYADKHSYAKALRLALMIAAASFLVGVFTMPQTRYLIILQSFLYSVCFAGMGVNLLNIAYSYVPKEYFVHVSAFKNSIGGVCGFLASLGAGALLKHIQANGNTFLGIHVYGQQVLALISFLLVVVAICFTKFVIEKQKVMIQ